jgi:phosphohistidine phosphatase
MDLYVVRHAIAEERRPGLLDADRSLTEEGELRFRRQARALRRLDVRFTELLHSPWRRAAQTAALLAELSERGPVAIDALAAPPGPALLEALRRDGRVALVGHAPWLSELVLWLVTSAREDGPARIRIKKGAVAHLSGPPEPGAMRLEALYPPKTLRALG